MDTSAHVRSISSRGFTFVEILVAVAIISLIALVSMTAFRNVYRSSSERIAALEVKDALKEARNKTLSAQNDTVYGVRVGTSSVTRFTGASYDPVATSNVVYFFEGGALATGTLVQNGVDIVFARLTGEPSATGMIYITDIDNMSTATVTISATGLIE